MSGGTERSPDDEDPKNQVTSIMKRCIVGAKIDFSNNRVLHFCHYILLSPFFLSSQSPSQIGSQIGSFKVH